MGIYLAIICVLVPIAFGVINELKYNKAKRGLTKKITATIESIDKLDYKMDISDDGKLSYRVYVWYTYTYDGRSYRKLGEVAYYNYISKIDRYPGKQIKIKIDPKNPDRAETVYWLRRNGTSSLLPVTIIVGLTLFAVYALYR